MTTNGGPTTFDLRVQKTAAEVSEARQAAQKEARARREIAEKRREIAEKRRKSRRRFLSPV